MDSRGVGPFPTFIFGVRIMEIKTHREKLYIIDEEGFEVRLTPEEVAELIGYLKVKVS